MRALGRVLLLLVTVGLLAMPASIYAADTQESQAAAAQPGVPLAGYWIAQINGSIFFPPPFDGLNGLFVRTARILFTPRGDMTVDSIANFGGVVLRETFPGTYSLTREGAIKIVFTNLPVPTLENVPNAFTFEGFALEGGKKIKVMLSSINLGGQELPDLGSVLWGELDRQ